jgi:hypothetical protein
MSRVKLNLHSSRERERERESHPRSVSRATSSRRVLFCLARDVRSIHGSIDRCNVEERETYARLSLSLSLSLSLFLSVSLSMTRAMTGEA